MRKLEDILQSCSDVLFPAELGRKTVEIHSADCDGDTPLHVIVRRSDVSGAKILIEAGAKVNAIGDMGETPLHIAVQKGVESIIEALLAAGADPDLRSEFGETPRERAAKVGGSINRAFRQLPPNHSLQARRP